MCPEKLTVEEYGKVHATAHRSDFGSFGLTVDRTPQSTVFVPETPRGFVIIDTAGTEQRLMRVGSATFDGMSPAGSVCLVPPNREVNLSWTWKSGEKKCLVLDFGIEAIEMAVPELRGANRPLEGQLDLRFQRSAALPGLATLLEGEGRPETRRGTLFRETAFRLFMLELHNHVLDHNDTPRQVRHDRRLRRAIDYIEAHFDTDLSLTDLCRAGGMSASQLTTLFRSQLNTSPYAYVITRRLAKAVQLLQRTEVPIAVVALDCGFADQSHMTRLFRARLGRTPASYRKGASVPL
jgi:AraC family transcriptional regulator